MAAHRGAAGTLDDNIFKQPPPPRGETTDNESYASDASAIATNELKQKMYRKSKDLLKTLATYKNYCSNCTSYYKKCQDPQFRNENRQEISSHLKQKHQHKAIIAMTPPTTEKFQSEYAFPETGNANPENITLTEQQAILNIRDTEEQAKLANAKEKEADVNKKRQLEEEQQPELSKYARMFEHRAFIPVKNKFQPLSDHEDSDIENMEVTINEENSDTTSVREDIRHKVRSSFQKQAAKKDTKNKPPPIILDGVIVNNTKYAEMTADLKKHAPKGFKIKFAKQSTIIQIEDPKEYKEYKLFLHGHSTTLFWHTYATQEDRTHAFVVKGLDHLPAPEEVKQELVESHQISVKDVFILKTNFRPLYMIVTNADYNLKQLQKIRYINSIHVTWERRNNSKKILQCRRCCMWGHGKSNCFRQIKCNKCAQQHYTINCTGEAPKKCANCGEGHYADSETCRVYQFKLGKIQQAKTAKPTYVPAPTPKTNAWNRQPQTRASGPTSATRASGGRIPARDPEGARRRRSSVNSENDYINNVNFSENCANFNKEFPSLVRPRPQTTEQQQPGESVTDLLHAMGRVQNAFNMGDLCRFLNDLADIKNKIPDKAQRAIALITFFTESINNYDI